MGWSLFKTQVILYASFAISFICGVIALILLQAAKDTNNREICYIFAIVIGTGLTCLWFRFFGEYVIISHGLISTVVFVLILWGRYNLQDDKLSTAYQNYGIDLFVMGLFGVQYILSFHFVVFRYGKSPTSKLRRTIFHTFCGALLMFVCIIDGCCRIHIFPAPNSDSASNNNAVARVLLIFISGTLMWYLLFYPSFDWRRIMILKKKAKKAAQVKERKAKEREAEQKKQEQDIARALKSTSA